MTTRRRFACVALLALGAAAGCEDTALLAPIGGKITRYVVTGLQLDTKPESPAAADLDGDGRVENALGGLAGFLVAGGNSVKGLDDLRGSGAWSMVLELQSEDDRLTDDERMGARLFFVDRDWSLTGAGFDAKLRDGHLTTLPTQSRYDPVSSLLLLPAMHYARPLYVQGYDLELELHKQGDGWQGWLRGAVRSEDLLYAASEGVRQMVELRPQEATFLMRWLDANRTGVVDPSELSPLLPSGDVGLDGGDQVVGRGDGVRPGASFAFALTLVPCASGTCAAPPRDRCNDGVQDGDETDVDCGGSCGACPADRACSTSRDCQSGACSFEYGVGYCTRPTCADGRLSGVESDVDCGFNCAPCAVGKGCFENADCASRHCSVAEIGDGNGLGVCLD